jgi:2-aminophenol/2-amino-5-chlorophenol 1,6-dioxygenase beta subunit
MTLVGHHVTRVPRLKGLSVDPIFPHLFRYNFDTAIDVELADAVYDEARAEGLIARKMTNPNFRLDYGTIVTSHMLNPGWDIPILSLSANNSPYYFSLGVGIEEMYKLGRATRRAIEKTGRRAVLAASNTLSHFHFDREPDPNLPEDMSKEHVFSHANYLWDMRVLRLMREGKMDELLSVLPEFIEKTGAEVKSGGLFWMLAAMGFPKIPARVHGYWSVIATGNAVVEWDLSAEVNGAGAQPHA